MSLGSQPHQPNHDFHHTVPPIGISMGEWQIMRRLDRLIVAVEKSLTININCNCTPPIPPAPPQSPAPGQPILGKGDSITMISITVDKLPAMPRNANGVQDVKMSLFWQEIVNGTPGEIKSKDVTANVGQSPPGVSIEVTDGSDGDSWCQSYDAAGNPSAPGAKAHWTSAADNTGSAAPDAPTLGGGDSLPDAGAAPVLGSMKKIS